MKRVGMGGLVLAGLLAGPAAHTEEVRWVADGELTAGYDSNVSRAERERDILRDESLLLSAGLTLLTEPTFGTALNFRLFAEAEAWRVLDPLDRTTAGGQIIGRWQPRPGYTAPVYLLTLSAQQDIYGVEQRDSLVYSAQLVASRRLNDRIRLAYGLEGVQRRSDGTVFDTAQGRAFLNADFELDAHWSAYTAYSMLRGDTFSSAQFAFCNGASANDIFGLIAAADALESDQAFDRAACGRWIAYRLPADTHALTLGLNRGFGHHLAADVSVQGVAVRARGDNDYERVLVRAGLLARF